MRFKSTISHYGLNALEKHYLPTLEKFGKHCDLMLSPEDVYLIQDVTDADGMQIVARLSGVRRQLPSGPPTGMPSTCLSPPTLPHPTALHAGSRL